MSIISALREEDIFITNVLNYLPAEYNRGYDDGDSSNDDESSHSSSESKSASRNPLRDEKQQHLRDKLHAKLTLLKEQSGSCRLQKRVRQRLNKLEHKQHKQQQTGKRCSRDLSSVRPTVSRPAANKAAVSVASSGGRAEQRPIYNDNGQLVFSKFDFACSDDAVSSEQRVGQSRRAAIHAQLVRAKRLKASAEKNGEAADRGRWQSALKKAEGQKVLDDVGLLAKSVRRRRQQKQRSRGEWQRRLENQQKQLDTRKQERSENIKRRLEARKTSRLNKLKKKGRIIAGF